MTQGTPLDPNLFGSDSACFGCAPAHPIGFRLAFVKTDTSVTTTFLPHERLEGPPGIMHGGLVTTLADEIAAWTVVAFTGRFGFTAALSARLLQPIRIGALVAGRGSIIGKSSGRVVRVDVQLEQNEKVAYTGELTFALLDEASAQRLLGRPLPESWKQFARGGRDGEV